MDANSPTILSPGQADVFEHIATTALESGTPAVDTAELSSAAVVDAGSTTQQSLTIKDISKDFERSFSPETAAILNTPYKQLVGPVEPTFKTLFLSANVKKEEYIAAAAVKLIQEVESLALYGVLMGHLANLSVIKLFSGEFNGKHVDGGWAVFIFPTVKFRFDPTSYHEVFDLFFHCHEGEVGRVYEPDQAALDMAAALAAPPAI